MKDCIFLLIIAPYEQESIIASQNNNCLSSLFDKWTALILFLHQFDKFKVYIFLNIFSL